MFPTEPDPMSCGVVTYQNEPDTAESLIFRLRMRRDQLKRDIDAHSARLAELARIEKLLAWDEQ